jgi:hypothetical protein
MEREENTVQSKKSDSDCRGKAMKRAFGFKQDLRMTNPQAVDSTVVVAQDHVVPFFLCTFFSDHQP